MAKFSGIPNENRSVLGSTKQMYNSYNHGRNQLRQQRKWRAWYCLEFYMEQTTLYCSVPLTGGRVGCVVIFTCCTKCFNFILLISFIIIMRCFSEWRTIPDKQKKIYLTRLGFEPATFGLLVRCSTNWATGQVGSWSSNDGTLGLFDISKQILVSSISRQ